MLQIVVVLWAVLLIQEDQCQLLLGILITGLLWVVIIHNKHTHLGCLYMQTFLNNLYLALNFANSSSYWRNSKHCHNSRLHAHVHLYKEFRWSLLYVLFSVLYWSTCTQGHTCRFLRFIISICFTVLTGGGFTSMNEHPVVKLEVLLAWTWTVNMCHRIKHQVFILQWKIGNSACSKGVKLIYQ